MSVFVIAEIGINHNGSIEDAKRLVNVAVESGCDAVKIQKRTPELCVPKGYRDVMRDTPWGRMSYLDYRKRIEFGHDELALFDGHCWTQGIPWFASCWDEQAVEDVAHFEVPHFKVPSAKLTDARLVRKMSGTGKLVYVSTGMSTMEEIDACVALLPYKQLRLAHSTSAYPCPDADLNLSMITTLRTRFPLLQIGYSGHEEGYTATLAAVALGAEFIERHITLDRTMWGSDQAASLEPAELGAMVGEIRRLEAALGDGIKRVYASERPALEKLRGASKWGWCIRCGFYARTEEPLHEGCVPGMPGTVPFVYAPTPATDGENPQTPPGPPPGDAPRGGRP